MAEFDKPKIIIDLEEYNILLENSNSEAILPYKELLEAILDKCKPGISDYLREKPLDIVEIISIADKLNLKINVDRHGNQLEIKSIERLKERR